MKKIMELTADTQITDLADKKSTKIYIIIITVLILVGTFLQFNYGTGIKFFYDDSYKPKTNSNVFTNKQVNEAIKKAQINYSDNYSKESFPKANYELKKWNSGKLNYSGKIGIVQLYSLEESYNYAGIIYKDGGIDKIVLIINAFYYNEVYRDTKTYCSITNSAEIEDLEPVFTDFGINTQSLVQRICKKGIAIDKFGSQIDLKGDDLDEKSEGIIKYEYLGQIYGDYFYPYIKITITK